MIGEGGANSIARGNPPSGLPCGAWVRFQRGVTQERAAGNDGDTMAVLRWLRDCLAEERSGRGITNAFATSVKARCFLSGKDSTTGGPTWMADLPPSQAEDIASRAALYRRECGLHFGTLFLTGTVAGRRLVAPVLLFPVNEAARAGGTFEIEARGWRFNPAVIDLLGLTDGWENEWSPRVDAVLDSGGAVFTAARAIQAARPDIGPEVLSDDLTKPGELKADADVAGLRLHVASALLLAERSPNVRGVLDEISRIESPGAVLEGLFGGESVRARSKPVACRTDCVPAILAAAQEQLLEGASREPLTVCHGPPGTGKTFTLAAAAIEHAARGEAVLVVCRSPKASDVMARTIERLAGTDLLTLRTGSKQAVGKLRDHIDLLLSRAYENDGVPRNSDLRRAAKVLGKEAREFEAQLAAAMRSGKWFDPEGAPRWWHRLGQWWEKPGESAPLLMEVATRLVKLQRERMQEAKEHLAEVHSRRLDRLLRDQRTRSALKQYRTALKRRASGAWERDLAAIDPHMLLAIFPIWIVESDDVHRVLPLQAGLFPLVVMDEASQCDLASAIPALHRGKRALIAGDPKQLRTVSFLPNHRLADLSERHGIPEQTRARFHFREVSLIDAAMDATDAVHFLCEHFRSRPELIAFSNDTFYRSRLRLMRELPGEAPRASAAVLQQVRGGRDPSGVNRPELEQVALFLRDWHEEQKRAGTKGSIGFLSPFRAQVDAFEQVVSGIIGREMLSSMVRDHELVAATAHGFQGDERDVMVLSLAVSDDCPAATRRFLEREDVFNVSITRARDRVVVFHSVTRERLPADSLLAGWLASLKRDHRLPVNDPACRWVAEVAGRLRQEGWTCESGRSVGGIAVDLVVDGGGKRLAIDVVGQRGRAGERVGLREQLLLQRAGLGMVPLGIHEWRTDPERCVEAVRDYLG